jgi:glycosyltransferase involved in cell wall biosynthesis
LFPIISDPIVSIVIPVYNGADFLREAIESALNQTYARIEVIVVNDGSTDRGMTERIAASYGNRIRYVTRPNGGVAAALNTGIRIMAGDFFSWLSHDDIYYSRKVETQLASMALESVPCAMLYSDFDIIDAHSRRTGTCKIPAVLAADPLLAILSTIVHGCSTLISREILDSVGLFDERLRATQDNDMWLRIHRRGFPIRHIPEVLIGSRKHAGQGNRKLSAVSRGETAGFYREVARSFEQTPIQARAILESIIQSGIRVPFSFLWSLWTANPEAPPSGWLQYLIRRVLASFRCRIGGKVNK